ncbi:precorrin-3B C(17)-methyltransferase [Deferribacteres bacterium DY0037]
MENRGKLYVIGNGPGEISLTAPKAADAIKKADLICGYKPYVEQITQLINARTEVFTNGMTGEMERVQVALEHCAKGLKVALVCGGDASLYSMASLVFELSEDVDAIEIIPGITSALSASAKLGAPVSDDMVILSMSDLLTPWELIRKRIDAVNIGDFVCAIYNPRSRKRTTQLPYAVEKFMTARGDLPCGWVKNCDREDEQICVTTLRQLDFEQIDMSTVVIVGSTKTFIKSGKMVSPRGYTEKYST